APKAPFLFPAQPPSGLPSNRRRASSSPRSRFGSPGPSDGTASERPGSRSLLPRPGSSPCGLGSRATRPRGSDSAHRPKPSNACGQLRRPFRLEEVLFVEGQGLSQQVSSGSEDGLADFDFDLLKPTEIVW